MSKKVVDYISATQIEKFLECPMCYKRIYVDGAARDDINSYIAYGDAMHQTFAHFYREKLSKGINTDILTMTDFFEMTFSKVLKKVPAHLLKQVSLLMLQGENMVAEYIKQIGNVTNPVTIEHKFTLEIHPGLKIHGYIDLVDDKDIIHDYKTCTVNTIKNWTQAYVDNLIQLTLYSIAHRYERKRKESGLQIDLLCRLKEGPSFNSILTTRNEIQHMNLIQLMLVMNEITEHDLWFIHLRGCPNQCEFRHALPKAPITAP